MTKTCFQRDTLRLTIAMVASLGVLALLAGCGPLLNPAQTPLPPSPTGTSSPLPPNTATVASTDTKTKEPSATPDLYSTFSPFKKETFNPESQAYLTSLDSRQVAETGSKQEDDYIKKDQAFHLYYSQGLIDFLSKQKVDVSSFKNTDLLVYDNAIKVYEALWKQIAKNPESYDTKWIPTPWLLEHMLNQSSNTVRSYIVQGKVHYGMWFGGLTENALLIKYNTTDIKKALQLDRDSLKIYKYTIPIFGKNIEIPRMVSSGPNYGVLTALADHPGYPDGSVKIIIMGFQDENGKWIYQPFAVNLGKNKTKAGDYICKNVFQFSQLSKDQEGYPIPVVGSNIPTAPSRKEYTLADLIKMTDHQVFGEPIYEFGSLTHSIGFLQYFFGGTKSVGGIESFGVVRDGGKADISPLSPADATPSLITTK